jgi:colanic acid biosynthesis glycosyl transferase WcaI
VLTDVTSTHPEEHGGRTPNPERVPACDPDLSGVDVCIVGINFAPETTGIAPYTTAMARALDAAGARVRVITGLPHYPQWKIVDDGYRFGMRWNEVHGGIPVTRVRHAVPVRPTLLGRARMELSFFVQATLILLADRSSVVVAVSPSLAGLAAAVLTRRGRPVGVVLQDLTGSGAAESGTTGSRAAAVIGAVEYALLRRVSLVGVVAPEFGSVAVSQGVAAAAVVHLPNFTHITPVTASRYQARARLGWDPERFTVVHTGNIGMKQGLESVVEAARLAAVAGSDVQFVLVGDGNQRRTLERAGDGLSTLRFVDPLDAEDYPYALAAADVLLLNERPGVRAMCLPSKLTSYVSSGRPVLAAVEPGGITHRTLDHDRAAHFVTPGSASALVEGVEAMRNGEDLCCDLAAGSRALHERYDAGAAMARYVRFSADLARMVRGREVRPRSLTDSE